MEEGEGLLKRFTDCVYFLASPLTCKKGHDCEYRHSEIARLNPRDCWYWLAGSCFNPSCVFRHPPLDRHIDASSEFTHPCYERVIPVNKTNVPCYFYFNGFCNKGEQCSFMHGPDDGKLASKSTQAASTVNGATVMDKEAATRTDTALAMAPALAQAQAPVKINTSETAKSSMEPRPECKQDFHRLAPYSVAEKSASPDTTASDSEEDDLVRSESLPTAEGFVQSRSLLYTDQSSEMQVNCHFEQEEWWESSPGFDVLVDDESEDVYNVDDWEYQPMTLDTDRLELTGRLLGYNENSVDYYPAYLDAGTFHEQDSYDHLDVKNNSEYAIRTPRQSRGRVFDRISLQKGNFSQMEPTYYARGNVDLRDLLKRRRLADDHSVNHFFKRHSSHLVERSRERPQWQGLESHHRAQSEDKSFLKNTKQQGRLKRSRIHQSKRHGRHQFISSEITRKSNPMASRAVEESSVFTGPKTLNQIKEEKKGQKNGDSYKTPRHSSRTSSEDFQGPKPLNEILEGKWRLASVISSYNDSS